MRLKWKIKMSAIVIIALAIIFAYSRADVFKMASAEEKVIVEEKKEKATLKGWGNKFFEALDQEVEDTKSFQKKQWLEMKKQFKKLFNRDDKDWEEVDKTIEEKK